VISPSPAATPVTIPLLLTLAMEVFDEDQVACVVTACVVVSENVAVAENCTLPPTTGAMPLKDTSETVRVGLDGVVEALG
jgi:hypothetical protein